MDPSASRNINPCHDLTPSVSQDISQPTYIIIIPTTLSIRPCSSESEPDCGESCRRRREKGNNTYRIRRNPQRKPTPCAETCNRDRGPKGGGAAAQSARVVMQYKKQVVTDKPNGVLVTGDQKHQIRDVVSGVVGHKLTTLPGKCRLCLLIQSQKHDTSHLSAHVPH